jgi:acyl-CoA synthetase (AMP-forming)/AMP-acid ligase II
LKECEVQLNQCPTLQAAFAATCAAYGGKEAVVFYGDDGQAQRRSYGDLYRDARHLAANLLGAGLAQGDHVAVWMPNSYNWLVVRFGVALAGLVLMPLNTRLRRDDLAQILRSSDARALVTDEQFASIDYLEILRSVGVLDACGVVARPDVAPRLDLVISISATPLAGLVSLQSLLREPPTGAGSPPQPDPADVLNIIFTSGTTSLPKGVVVQNGAAAQNLLRINERWGQQAADKFMLCQPLFTSAGLGRSTATLLAGATLVLQEGFNAREFVAIAAREGVTATALSDTNVLDLIDLYQDANAQPLPRLRIRVVLGLLSAGAVSKHAFLRDKLGVQMVLSHYGLSETSHMTSLSGPQDSAQMSESSVGRPLTGVEIRIVDPVTGQTCPTGEVGEIRVGGYIISPGYYQRPDATRDMFDEAGFLRTGDLGWVDAAGYLYFQCRLKDIIRTGGFNVTAGEIEAILRAQPEVREVSVVPVPDERLGEVPCAFVEFAGSEVLTADDFRARLKGGVATYKLPRHVIPVVDWPRTGSEKIQKPALVEMARLHMAQEAQAL